MSGNTGFNFEQMHEMENYHQRNTFYKGRKRNLISVGHLQVNTNNNPWNTDTKHFEATVNSSLSFTRHVGKTQQ